MPVTLARMRATILGIGYAQVVVALLAAARLGSGAAGAGGAAASGLVVVTICVPIGWHVRFVGQVGSHGTSGRRLAWMA